MKHNAAEHQESGVSKTEAQHKPKIQDQSKEPSQFVNIVNFLLHSREAQDFAPTDEPGGNQITEPATSGQIADALIRSMLGPSRMLGSSGAGNQPVGTPASGNRSGKALTDETGDAGSLQANAPRKGLLTGTDPGQSGLLLVPLPAGLRPGETNPANGFGDPSKAGNSLDAARNAPTNQTTNVTTNETTSLGVAGALVAEDALSGLAFGAVLTSHEPGSMSSSQPLLSLQTESLQAASFQAIAPVGTGTAPGPTGEAKHNSNGSMDEKKSDQNAGNADTASEVSKADGGVGASAGLGLSAQALSTQALSTSASAMGGTLHAMADSRTGFATDRTVESAAVQTPSLAARVHEMTIRVSQPEANPVDLQVTHRQGEVVVMVRTPDAALQTSLRQNLPDLVSSLDRSGFHAETFIPRAVASVGMAEMGSGSLSHGTLGGNFGQGDLHQGSLNQDPRREGFSRDGSRGGAGDRDPQHQQHREQHSQQQRDRMEQKWFERLA